MNPALEAAAQALEAERARPMPSSQNADDRLVALFLANVKGEGGEPARVKQHKAMERIVARLRREHRLTFTALLVVLLNDAATSQGWL